MSESATPKKVTVLSVNDYRVIKLRKYLESHNSPLSPYASEIVFWADYYQLDWRLVPAISGVESTFGKRIPRNSYNAYGWANGNYSFESWSQSVEVVSETLRTKYKDDGLVTLRQISRRYAPPSSTWTWKVNYFMNDIDTASVKFDF